MNLQISKKNIAQLVVMVAFFVFIGCGTSINLRDYNSHILQKSPNMPSKTIMSNSGGVNIIVVNIDNSKIKKAIQANLGNAMSISLKQVFANDKSAIVLERVEEGTYKQILQKEIQLAELGMESEDDVGQAQFILRGKLNKATFSNTYKKGYSYYTKRNNRRVRVVVAPKRIYKACVGGVIKIITLPSLSMEKSVGFNRCVTSVENNANRYDYAKRNDDMMIQAGENGIKQASYELRNFFSKKGYIYESKIKNDDIIIKTSLSLEFGAKEGEDVEIFTIKQETNILTGKTNKVHIKIGTGTISDKTSNNYSWIIVNNLQKDASLHLGDYVKVKYEAGFFD
jgi:hypothetical protein